MTIASLWKSARARVLIVVGSVGLFLSAGDIFEPLDELIYSGQAYLLRRPASGQVVLIQITPHHVERTNGWPWDYNRWADVTDRVAKLNPKSVFFDFLIVRPRPAVEEARFAQVLDANRGKLIFGTLFESDRDTNKITGIAPIRPFIQRSARLAAINYRSGELGDYRNSPYALSYFGRTYPSAPAALLGIARQPGTEFKVDKTIDLNSIPRYSIADLYNGKIPRAAVAGKYLIVAGAFYNTDEHLLFPYFRVSGGLLQAMGTETLIQGVPVYIWPVFVFVALFLFGIHLHWRLSQLPPWRLYFTVVMLVVALSFALINFGVILPFASAIGWWSMIAWSDAWVRMRERSRTEGALVNATSGFPNFEALERSPPDPDVAVIAGQLPGLEASLRSSKDRDLTGRFASLVVPSPGTTVYDGGHGTLFWCHPLSGPVDLVEHLQSLARLVLAQEFSEGLPEHPPHFGVDLDVRAAMSDRAAAALQASIDAKAEGILLHTVTPVGPDRLLEVSSIATIDAFEVSYRPLKSAEAEEVAGALLQVVGSDAVETDVSFGSSLDREPAFALFERMLDEAASLLKSVLPVREWFQVAVPLPAAALLNPYLLETVRTAVRRFRVSAEALSFVIHVPDLHRAGARNMKALSELRSLGLDIALRGFDQHDRGVDYIRSIPATQLLTDARFSDLSVEENWRLAQSTVALAGQLGRAVIFTGVADSRSLRLLSSLSVDRIEGPVVGEAMSLEALVALLGTSTSNSKGNLRDVS